MDDQNENRKKISLEKDGKEDSVHSPVREAYPVYKEEPDMELLQKAEYRNTPSFDHFNNEVQYEEPEMNYELPPVQQASPFPPVYNPGYQNGVQYNNNVRYFVPQQGGPRHLPKPMPNNRQFPQAPGPNTPPNNAGKTYTNMKYCKYCGQKILSEAVVCTHCGRQVDVMKKANAVPPPYAAPKKVNISQKSKKTTMTLALLGLFGIGGLHRFYSGKILSGILYFLTGGLFFIGTIVDLFKINNDEFTDSDGYYIKR